MPLSESDKKEVAAMIARSLTAATALQFAARAQAIPRAFPPALLEMAAQEPESEVMTEGLPGG